MVAQVVAEVTLTQHKMVLAQEIHRQSVRLKVIMVVLLVAHQVVKEWVVAEVVLYKQVFQEILLVQLVQEVMVETEQV
jgi:lipoprotein signal peptidase